MTVRDFAYYQSVFSRIASDPVVTQGDRADALRTLTREVALAMNVDFVGFWAYDQSKSKITSEANYHRASNGWNDGAVLAEVDAPIYFSAIKQERVLPVEDCFSSPYTAEFRESYCRPHDIQALVDVPVLIDGTMVGIICCELVGSTRQWSTEDKFFALIAADFVGRVLEADQRRDLARKLERENDRLGEEQLKALLMALPVPLAMLDRESRYLAMSDSWLQQYSFSLANPFGVEIWKAHEHYDDVWKQRILQAQNGEILGREEEHVEISPGNFVWLSWQLAPWYNLQGEVGGVVILCEDVSYRKETEVKLRQTTKLAALGEMAGGIAHEINNPLSIMKGFIDLMQKNIARGKVEPEVFNQYLEKSSNTIQRISRTVQAMKRISRDSSQDPMSLNSINLILRESLEFVQEKFRDDQISIQIEELPIDVKVHCRPIEISQVLLNLLTNSMHAVEKGGWVKIAAEIGPGRVRVLVKDSGKGIAPENRERIFNPFFTTKDIGKGTGLGLSISRKMIEGHQGRLYLQDKVPHTTFVIELPLPV